MSTVVKMSLSEAQVELSELKSELQEKRQSVSTLRSELDAHGQSLDTLRNQRDKLQLAVGLASEDVRAKTLAVKRNAGRPNAPFTEAALKDAQAVEQSAQELLDAFDKAGAIALQDALRAKTQDKLKLADLELSKMSRKASELQTKFVAMFAAHGQSLFDAAQSKLKPISDHLEAERLTLQELTDHCDAESLVVRNLKAEQFKLVQQSTDELSDFPALQAKLSGQFATPENDAIRAVLTAFNGLLEILTSPEGDIFRNVNGQRWWDLVRLLWLDQYLGKDHVETLMMRRQEIREFIAHLK